MISDEELRTRLQAHNFVAPPITDSTRSVLLKKLNQLDSQNPVLARKSKVNGNGSRLKSPGRSSKDEDLTANLLEYSSADDEALTLSPPISSTPLRKRISTSSRKSQQRSRTPIKKNPPPPPQVNGYSSSSRPSLLQQSEAEEDEDEEVESEEEEEIPRRQQNRRNNRFNLGVPTGGLEDEDEDGGEEEEEDEDERRQQVRYRGRRRFAGGNSSLISPVPSTSTYLNEGEKSSFPLSSSQLRKQIAKDKDSFGSLGEALSSMPRSPIVSSSSSPPTSSMFSSMTAAAATAPNGDVILTQVSPLAVTPTTTTMITNATNNNNKNYRTKSSSFCNSHSISKLIICLAGIFFVTLAFKYSSLRPSPDIGHRISICREEDEEDEEEEDKEKCVGRETVDDILELYKRVIRILETKAVECFGKKNETDQLRREEVLELLGEDVEEGLYKKLLGLLAQNPHWGIQVTDEEEPWIRLNYSPPVDWSCWIARKFVVLYAFLCVISLYAFYFAVLTSILVALFKLRTWHKERQIRMQQDVFELVEQILSIIASQQNSGRNPDSYIAINHVRDQLIPPADRKRKRHLWEKAVNYIREYESRIREDIQPVYGEETRVWQWIPGICLRGGGGGGHQAPPSSSPSSMNNNLPVTTTSFSSSSSSSQQQQQQQPSRSTPVVLPNSPHWQGSAFNSLNKNVAAPQVAPTACLKVRHMFDSQAVRDSSSNWALQVKEEILRRCSPTASILHVAVDKQSPEGCVYIKALNTESAGNIFNCLHGQWYRGNLITVKYLREERYNERFQDARYARTPLTLHHN